MFTPLRPCMILRVHPWRPDGEYASQVLFSVCSWQVSTFESIESREILGLGQKG